MSSSAYSTPTAKQTYYRDTFTFWDLTPPWTGDGPKSYCSLCRSRPRVTRECDGIHAQPKLFKLRGR